MRRKVGNSFLKGVTVINCYPDVQGGGDSDTQLSCPCEVLKMHISSFLRPVSNFSIYIKIPTEASEASTEYGVHIHITNKSSFMVVNEPYLTRAFLGAGARRKGRTVTKNSERVGPLSS